mmetsp:Transcript_27234/g.53544  ORF Transcript_27234/g.53544 Transcript_27234/m.53544 type:complete len:117 (+) Transcript_27234:113-463(+)
MGRGSQCACQIRILKYLRTVRFLLEVVRFMHFNPGQFSSQWNALPMEVVGFNSILARALETRRDGDKKPREIPQKSHDLKQDVHFFRPPPSNNMALRCPPFASQKSSESVAHINCR